VTWPQAGWPLDSVEVAQGLSVGAHQARLPVRHASLQAERFDQGLGAAQVGARHRWEQMVLDLVIQAAQGNIGQPAATHIAGGQYLAAQEVAPVARVQDRHALVVGGEGAAQVQAEQALLHQDEHRGFHR
jgi:hypothetical protein